MNKMMDKKKHNDKIIKYEFMSHFCHFLKNLNKLLIHSLINEWTNKLIIRAKLFSHKNLWKKM